MFLQQDDSLELVFSAETRIIKKLMPLFKMNVRMKVALFSRPNNNRTMTFSNILVTDQFNAQILVL